jgi:hypothetical protein
MGTFLTTGALKEDVVEIVSSVTPLVLTPNSPSIFHVTGVTNQIIQMPDATDLLSGIHYIFINNTTDFLTLQDSTTSEIKVLGPSLSSNLYLVDTSTPAGVWAESGGGGGSGIQINATLLHTQAVPVVVPEFTFEIADCQSKIFDYAIKETTTNHVRTGKIMIAVNDILNTVALQDFFIETANLGVEWYGTVNLPDVEISYTTIDEDSHTDKNMTATIKNILF